MANEIVVELGHPVPVNLHRGAIAGVLIFGIDAAGADEPYKVMEWPCAVEQPAGGHLDYVTDLDSNVIGYTSDSTYSSYYHVTAALATIDIDKIQEGSEVLVHWGDFGSRIKKIRATIVKYPYIHSVMDNRDYLSTVPSGLK